MAEIQLTRGYCAIVDDECFEWLSQYRWHVIAPGKCLYAARDVKDGGKRHYVYMHRVVMGLGKGDKILVDHINGNSLDNRKQNLRLATKAQNAWNTKSIGGRSRFKGVNWHPPANKWVARIKANNSLHYLGVFSNEEDAAMAYDKAAMLLHGQYARLNLAK